MEKQHHQDQEMAQQSQEGQVINDHSEQSQPTFQPIVQNSKNKRKAATKEKVLMILLIANLALTMLVGIGVVYDIVQQKNAGPENGQMFISPENAPSTQQGGSSDSGPTFKTTPF